MKTPWIVLVPKSPSYQSYVTSIQDKCFYSKNEMMALLTNHFGVVQNVIKTYELSTFLNLVNTGKLVPSDHYLGNIYIKNEFEEHLNITLLSREDTRFARKLNRVLEDNIHNCDFSFEKVPKMMNIGRTSLYKKVLKIYQCNPHELITEIRMKRAKRLLVDFNHTVTETTFEVGYLSIRGFSAAFKKHYGILPNQMIKSSR